MNDKPDRCPECKDQLQPDAEPPGMVCVNCGFHSDYDAKPTAPTEGGEPHRFVAPTIDGNPYDEDSGPDSCAFQRDGLGNGLVLLCGRSADDPIHDASPEPPAEELLLEAGDIVRHVGTGDGWIVHRRNGDGTYIAVRVQHISNPSEWRKVGR